MSDEKNLNKEQLEAIKHKTGPLLIIAGAGTGKTTVITERIKYLVSSELAKPSEILALTFTDKAAREMEERVDVAMPYGYTQMWISTFHSFCDRILRQEALNIGMDPKYNLMTSAETIQFVRQNLFKFDLNYFRPLGNPNKFIEGLVGHFSRLKDEDVDPSQYLQFAKKTKLEKEEKEKTLELARAYQIYEELKIRNGMMDFDDLIFYCLKVFRTRKNVLKKYQEQFKYILIDEFQDTNFTQNELAILLSGKTANLTVCGDDDQSIYRFRGAAVSNIIQFRQNFPKAKIVVLTKNYRSTQEILNRSYTLIQNNNPDRLEVKEKIKKQLESMRKVNGKPVEFIKTDRVENEAEAVAKTIKQLTINNYQFKDIAILVRANNHADPFVRALARAGIPHQFLGPGMLFKQAEVKELISYLKLLSNVSDSVAAYRVLTMDNFAISPRDIASIMSFARKNNMPLLETIEQIEKVFTSEETKSKVGELVKMIHRHLGLIKKESAGQILYYFLQDSGLLKELTSLKNQDERQVQNISKFFNKLKSYEADHEDSSVYAVSDWLDLSMEMGESPKAADTDWTEIDAVNILTVHSAKGLEFSYVFLVNLVSQRFPTNERHEQIPIPQELIKEILPEGDYHLQEERRLFYVGLTRAKDKLFLTASNFYGEGKRERKISPFVFETLGEDAVIQSNNQQLTINNQLSFSDWEKTPEQSTISNTQLTINKISYSEIETFKDCPLHYKLRFILNIPTPSSSAQSFGTSVHATLRDFLKSKMEGKLLAEKDLLELLESNWVSEGYKDKKHEELVHKKGVRMLKDFYHQTKGSKVLPHVLEQPFSFPLGKVKVVGRLDRVDPTAGGKIEIIDYKTGASIPTQKDVDQNLQLTIYALAATEVKEEPFGKKPEEVLLSLHFIETGEKITTTRTKEQLEKAKKEILEIVDEIEKSDFKCSPSIFCKHCEFQLLCDKSD